MVCVHGLWMTGIDMSLLRRRLAHQLNCSVQQFSYPTITRGMKHNTAALSDFVAKVPADRVHLVGHSLGGVLSLQMLRHFPTDKVGRVVCLGSPLVDSRVARDYSRWQFGHQLVGKTLREGVLHDPLSHSDSQHETGVIAGSFGIGLGVFAPGLSKPHDGIVSVAETKLSGINDHLVMRINHVGLLVNKQVACQAGHFLQHGAFAH